MQEIAVTEEEDTQATASAEVAELEQRIADTNTTREVLVQKMSRLKSQKELLNKYSSGLFAAGGQAKTADLLDPQTIGTSVSIGQ